MRSVMQWIVRRAWRHLPVLPLVAFVAIVGVIVFAAPHLPCAPLTFDLGLRSEDEIPIETYPADAPPGSYANVFRYQPTGTEFNSGVPYWIFRALPRLYPDVFKDAPPDAPYSAFGLLPAAGGRANRLPRGMALADTTLDLPGLRVALRLKRVAFNCSACHQSEYFGEDGRLHYADGMPNHVGDLQAYKRFIYRAVSDPDFTADRVIAAIDAELAASDLPALTIKERLVYTAVVDKMRDPNAMKSWMNARPANGPGRIDAFDAVKYETLKVADDGQNACVDLPSVWNQGPAIRPWHHWDGNTRDLHARNYGSVVGVGGSPWSVRVGNVDKVGEWLDEDLAPPKFPFAKRRDGDDEASRARGKQVYLASCAGCHGVYDPATRAVTQVGTADKPSQYMQRVDVATDDRRWKAFDQVTCDALNAWGASVGVWSNDSFRPAAAGYLAGPLDGIWARAPYLHNGSVPTLRALLAPPKSRPATFYRGSRYYDPVDMGWESKDARERGGRALFRYDVDAKPLAGGDQTVSGNHNDGHDVQVAPADVEPLLDYLATL